MNTIPLRRLTAADVTFHVVTEDEERPPRAGEDFDSGNAEADKALERELCDRLDNGDVWAWAYVTVVARWRSPEGAIEGEDSLGCCSYANEADFRQPGGYFDDMCERALDDLNARLRRQALQIAPLLGIEIAE
jgi:hypothetical protein